MIIIDTNMLMELNTIDIFERLKEFSQFGEPIIFSCSLRELRKLKTKQMVGKYTAIPLRLIKDKKIKLIKTKNLYADYAILKFAKPEIDAVATNDKKLIKELKTNKIRVLRLRQRRYFVLE